MIKFLAVWLGAVWAVARRSIVRIVVGIFAFRVFFELVKGLRGRGCASGGIPSRCDIRIVTTTLRGWGCAGGRLATRCFLGVFRFDGIAIGVSIGVVVAIGTFVGVLDVDYRGGGMRGAGGLECGDV